MDTASSPVGDQKAHLLYGKGGVSPLAPHPDVPSKRVFGGGGQLEPYKYDLTAVD